MTWPILTARITEKNLPAGRETNHRDPKEILEEIETGKKKLESSLSEIKKLL